MPNSASNFWNFSSIKLLNLAFLFNNKQSFTWLNRLMVVREEKMMNVVRLTCDRNVDTWSMNGYTVKSASCLKNYTRRGLDGVCRLLSHPRVIYKLWRGFLLVCDARADSGGQTPSSSSSSHQQTNKFRSMASDMRERIHY